MRPARRKESGFALLLVFAMAAAVGIMLYTEMPRLVFESQRIVEQDVMYRGEQYKRAIQLFVRENQRYPTTIDELEETNNKRYLRRRYKDPLTGEEEWRLIHIDGAGFYTDSIIHEPQAEEEQGTKQNTFITEGAAFGSTGTEGTGEQQNLGATVRGASDRPVVTEQQYFGVAGQPGVPPQPGQAGVDPSTGQPIQAGQPPYAGQYSGQPVPGQPGMYPAGMPQPGGAQPVPGFRLAPGQQVPNYQQQPGQLPQANPGNRVGLNQYMTPGQTGQPAGQMPNYPIPTSGVPGLPGPYGQQANPTGQQNPAGQATRTGQFVAPVQQQTTPPSAIGQTPSAPGGLSPGNQAVDLIRSILTTPRPGGLAGVQGNQQSGQMAGGIAGVASKLEAEGIMVYNERTKYNEWEFLYDYREDQAATAAAQAGAAGVQGGGGQQGGPFGGPGGVGPGGNRNPRSGGGNQGSFGGPGGFGGRGGGAQGGGGFGGRGGGFGGQGQGASPGFGGAGGTPRPPGRGQR